MTTRDRTAQRNAGPSRRQAAKKKTRSKTATAATAGAVKRNARVAAQSTERVAANPWLLRAARWGYVVRAFLYATVGFLALRAATGWGGETEDLRGSLILIPGGPVRPVVLLVLIIGLTGYGLWGFIRAVFDPLNRGSDVTGLAARIGFAWSGFNYLMLAVFSVLFLVGASNSDGSDNLYKAVNSVMVRSGGWMVLVVAGGVGTLAGLGQFVDAYRAGFRKDLKRAQMTAQVRTTVDTLGRFGMVARGVVFTLLGWFILQAGLAHDSAKSENMREVFATLGGLPMGHALLGLVAVGFVALGLHSAACARWVRMPQGR